MSIYMSHDVLRQDRFVAMENMPEHGVWLGVTAIGDVPVAGAEVVRSAHGLRHKVYVDEYGWIDNMSVHNEEYDEFDPYSTHMAAVANINEDSFSVFSTIRFIHPDEDITLPIETEFGIQLDTKEPKVEMSRFISRHPNSRMQTLGSIAMVSSTIGLLNRNELVGYATLEKKLLRRLRGFGLVIDELGAETALDHYGGTVNLPVRIDGPLTLQNANKLAQGRNNFPYARFFDIATHGGSEELMQEIITVFSEKNNLESRGAK